MKIIFIHLAGQLTQVIVKITSPVGGISLRKFLRKRNHVVKVKELIKILEKMDGELEVYRSSDDEGNDIIRADEVVDCIFSCDIGKYRLENIAGYSECYDRKNEKYYEEYDSYKQVVIIW